MLPIILDIKDMTLAVIGGGLQAQRRLQMIDAAGAAFVRVYAVEADADMRALAGDRLIEALPSDDEISACDVVYVANLDDSDAERIVAVARANKTLVNVEDVKPFCDFHVPAIVRRGDLLLTASTGGQSPGLARRLKIWLEQHFSADWSAHLAEISDARSQWQAEGASFRELIDRTDELIDKKGWLA